MAGRPGSMRVSSSVPACAVLAASAAVWVSAVAEDWGSKAVAGVAVGVVVALIWPGGGVPIWMVLPGAAPGVPAWAVLAGAVAGGPTGVVLFGGAATEGCGGWWR